MSVPLGVLDYLEEAAPPFSFGRLGTKQLQRIHCIPTPIQLELLIASRVDPDSLGKLLHLGGEAEAPRILEASPKERINQIVSCSERRCMSKL